MNYTKLGGYYSHVFKKYEKKRKGMMTLYRNREVKICHVCSGRGYTNCDQMHVCLCTLCKGRCVLPLDERDLKEIAKEVAKAA